MKTPDLFSIATSILLGASVHAQVVLEPLNTFGPNGDGSMRPGDQTYLTTGSLQRGMVFNQHTGHLLIVNRDDPANGVFSVRIMDATTGADVGVMQIPTLVSDAGNTTFLLNQIGIADDGAIYVCNLSSSTTPPQLILYRAVNEASPLEFVNVTPPTSTDPSNGEYANNNQRWGDTLTVRGSGAGTQILLGTQSGTKCAIYTPTDETLSHFVATTLSTDAIPGGAGFGLAFGLGNTFWAKGASTAGFPLFRLGFDLGAGTATIVQSNSTLVFPGRVGPIAVNLASNLLAALESITGRDRVRLYDFSNLSVPPVLLDWTLFATNGAENNVFGGAFAFGTNNVGEPMLWALSCNSGIMAYKLVPGSRQLAPTIIQQPLAQVVTVGSNVIFTAAVDGIPAPTTFRWYFNTTTLIPDAQTSTLSIPDAQTTSSGNYTIVAENSSGSVTSSAVRLTVISTTSGLLGYEPFNYTSGQLLSAANPAIWSVNGTGDDATVVPDSLSIAGLAPSTGNSITNGGSGAGMRYTFGPTIIEGSLYYSFAMRMDSVGEAFTSTSGFVAALVDGNANTYATRLIPRTNTVPGEYNLGVGKVNSSAAYVAWAPDTFVEGQVVFIVGRYTFGPASGDDTADLWINPDPSSFGNEAAPAPTLSALPHTTDMPLLNQFTFRQNSAANTPAAMTFDEVRIGRSWASVTPVTIATPPTLSVALNGNNVMISWPTNASTGFVLESENALAGDADGWQTVETAVIVQGTNHTVTVSPTARQFFRLYKPVQ